MKKNKKYKVIFIDWNGTLCVSLFWHHWKKKGTKKKKAFEVIQTFFGNSFGDLINPWMRGNFSAEYFVDQVSLKSGFTGQTVMQGLIESCQKVEFISSEIPQLVTQLRSTGTKVVIATDNMDTFHRWVVPALKIDLLFDGILNSHQLKALKEDFDQQGNSLFFGKYLKENQIKKGQAVLVDDSRKTAEIAAKVGLDFFKLDFGEGPVGVLKSLL